MTGKAPAHGPEFLGLIEFLKHVPGVRHNDTPSFGIGAGVDQDGLWWIKFGIDIDHPLAWSDVQELGHVLNYLSMDERLPTAFLPVALPPYMNGGPRDFLPWVIQSKSPDFSPERAREWLEGRLPRPVQDLTKWPVNQGDDLGDQD